MRRSMSLQRASSLLAIALLLPRAHADTVLERAGVKGGLIVHVGCDSPATLAELRAGDQYVVHGLDTDAANVAAARAMLRTKGVYGATSVDQWDGRNLPYADNLVNLVIVPAGAAVKTEEIMRVLAPNGVSMRRGGGTWQKTVKPWPKEMDEWTHYLHGPDGNPVANDSLVGPPTRLQWVAGPNWARHHDHMASMTSCVSAGGRVFYIFDEGRTASIQFPSKWRLVARDAFNGTLLWRRTIDNWNTRHYPLKSGPAHLLRRLVAVGDHVFVTLGIDAPVTVLDAATGKTLRAFEGSDYTREIVVTDGVALLVADSSPSRLPSWRRVSTYVWENTSTANPGWGWNGAPRKVLAYSTESGSLLWQADAPVAPCSLAADSAHVVFQDGEKLVCLDRGDGKVLWQSEAAPTRMPVHTNTGPRVLIYRGVVLYAGNDSKVSGWSLSDGKKLWEQVQKPSGHMSLKDLFVVDGLSWTGAIAGNRDDGTFIGYDAFTGEKKREFPADVKVHWFHHRCYPAKAAGKYLITGRNGTEYVNVDTEHWKANHWIRGGCIYGVMPCNGMTYASMDACGCQLEAKIQGFKAVTGGPVPRFDRAALAGDARLLRGPAYGDGMRIDPEGTAGQWATYRGDTARSGSTSVAVPANLQQVWQANVGGRLSAPTVADGRLFVVSIDTHTVHAFDAGSGKELWSFTAGGRIDSPPTLYGGRAFFGSADGWVYALRSSDGALAWRFRCAPADRRLMSMGQLESAWPVHGSVLIYNDTLYCTAGRSIYLDGGIRLVRLDPETGKLLGEVVWDDKDPETGEDMHLAYLKKTPGNTMPVGLSDVLSCDGRNIWMRSQKIDFNGKRHEIATRAADIQPDEDMHLFCQIGLLDDSWFFRSYWTYGRSMTGGYGGWFQAGRVVPSGRIMCFDDKRVYGFGRKPEYMVNSSVIEYQLFAADKVVTPEAKARMSRANREMNARMSKKNANSSDWRLRYFYPSEDLTSARFEWLLKQPTVIARAMVAAGDTLFIAGPPDFIDERFAYHNPDNPDVMAKLALQDEAFDGKHGGLLWAVAKSDGSVVTRYALDTIPRFDGMAAAGSSLYMSTVDGRILSFAGRGGTPLVAADDQAVQLVWDKPEDPDYLPPPEEPKNGDFAVVKGCQVVASELGYRLKPPGDQKATGIALRKLDTPIKSKITLRTKLMIPGVAGVLRNGFIAFQTS